MSKDMGGIPGSRADASSPQAVSTKGVDPGRKPTWMTARSISHDEALLSADRLINSHFNNPNAARVSIPANPERDDDLLILAYIWQQRGKEKPNGN